MYIPQFDTSTYLGQILWLFITYFLLFLWISMFLSPRLKNHFEKRKSFIESDYSSAKTLIQNADYIANSCANRLDDVRRDNLSELLKQKIKMEAEYDLKVGHLSRALHDELQEHRMRISRASDRMFSDINQELSDFISNF